MASGVRLLPQFLPLLRELRGACITSYNEELRDSFLTRLEHAKKLFFSRKSVDNAQFMNALLAKLDRL